MSTHNICFCREIRKILCGYSLLSVAMITYLNIPQSRALKGKNFKLRLVRKEKLSDKTAQVYAALATMEKLKTD